MVDHRKPWLSLAIQKNLDGAGADVADDAHVMPRMIWQRGCGLQTGDPVPGSAVNNKEAIVDGDLGPRIVRKMDIVEVERIYVVENNNHGSAGATHLHVESKAADLNAF